MNPKPIYSVSDFVAVCNQVLDMSFGTAEITGELANFKISKNRWVYFDLKDDYSSLRFFGTIYNLPGPLEDGMMLTVRGVPQLHPRFGFSVTVQSIQLQGEGTIKKASQLLEAKLAKEGLFDPTRKRTVPYPPETIGLIASGESAAYADFVKIINQRWSGLKVQHCDVQVQGDAAPSQIVKALEYFNSHAETPEVLVIIRGGGSADDLQAFSTEAVTRAIASSRIPTLVAIGHEVDVSLAELASDQRASTPSNAAELLVPDKKQVMSLLNSMSQQAVKDLERLLHNENEKLIRASQANQVVELIKNTQQRLEAIKLTARALDPDAILRRGYSVVRSEGKIIKTSKLIKGTRLELTFSDGVVRAETT